MNKKKVLFLFGGQSGEHEVSIVSAKAVIENLDKEKYEPIEVGITKNGEWIIGDDIELLKKGGDVKPDYELMLSARKVEGKSILLKLVDNKVEEEILFDIAFPVLHGTFGEDGTLQGLLEFYQIPYAGPDLTGSVTGIDKVLFKQLMNEAQIPNAKFLYYRRSKYDADLIAKDIERTFGYPVFVKPSNTGSSVGVSKVENSAELKDAVEDAFKFFDKILIEQAVPNAREIEVSALGNWDNVEVSIPGEVIPGDEFYSYEDKYIDDKSQTKIPADLEPDVLEEIRNLASKVFRTIHCTGMARVDFLLDGETNDIYINEVNTIPGFTSISMYPKLWEASGLSFRDLVTKLIELGVERHEEKCKNVVSIDSSLLRK